jgi:hypothetical protein
LKWQEAFGRGFSAYWMAIDVNTPLIFRSRNLDQENLQSNSHTNSIVKLPFVSNPLIPKGFFINIQTPQKIIFRLKCAIWLNR